MQRSALRIWLRFTSVSFCKLHPRKGDSLRRKGSTGTYISTLIESSKCDYINADRTRRALSGLQPEFGWNLINLQKWREED